MSKIIKIENDIVSIGNDDGSLSEIRVSDCNFSPNLGDTVNVFSSEGKTICVKAEDKKQENIQSVSDLIKNGGINIHLNQTQESNGVGNLDGYCNIGSKHVVGKLPYVLFAVFLGGLGGHKFYAGKPGQGILYLLFCWTSIPSILGFIEGIIAACQQADNAGRILV